MRNQLLPLATLGLTLLAAACGGETPRDPAVAARAFTAGEPAASGATAATGNVIRVRMVTDASGSYFEPAEVVARPGDVIRYVLDSGVHNVSFPADGNAGASGLPGVGPYLQVPGQSYDYTVGLAPGSYRFVCDPHVAMGMVGTLRVE